MFLTSLWIAQLVEKAASPLFAKLQTF